MRHVLAPLCVLAIVLCAVSACAVNMRPPGQVKHADGPGNSENAPGHLKH